jgi:hypothetical protein
MSRSPKAPPTYLAISVISVWAMQFEPLAGLLDECRAVAMPGRRAPHAG